MRKLIISVVLIILSFIFSYSEQNVINNNINFYSKENTFLKTNRNKWFKKFEFGFYYTRFRRITIDPFSDYSVRLSDYTNNNNLFQFYIEYRFFTRISFRISMFHQELRTTRADLLPPGYSCIPELVFYKIYFKIVPIDLSIIFSSTYSNFFNLYWGGGISVVSTEIGESVKYDYETPLEQKDIIWGYHIIGGANFKIFKFLLLDCNIKYSDMSKKLDFSGYSWYYTKLELDNVQVNIGLKIKL